MSRVEMQEKTARQATVEVDDHCIRIRGSKDVLERAVLAGQAAAEPGSQMSTRWRASRNKTANTYTIEIPL